MFRFSHHHQGGYYLSFFFFQMVELEYPPWAALAA